MSKEMQIRQAFVEEAREELLPELESGLLELGQAPDNPELINRVFRALHTLKGSGAMFGFDRLSELAHEMESIFDRVRNGQQQVDIYLVELSLAAKDQFQLLVDEPEAADESRIDELMGGFSHISSQTGGPGRSEDDAEEIAASSGRTAYYIRFKPRPEIFATGANPLFLLDELHGLGAAVIIAHTDNIPSLEDIDPESCYTWWDILLFSDEDRSAINDVFIFVEDDCELIIEAVRDHIQPEEEDAARDNLAHLQAEGEIITAEILKKIVLTTLLSDIAPGGPADDYGTAGKLKTNSGQTGDGAVASGQSASPSSRSIASMRVRAAKLDKLVNLVGELVIAQTRLSRLAEEREDQDLVEVAEVIERLSNDLRENTLAIRMLPIGSSFGKFKRVVWDFSAQTGKAVELITEGAGTELDKTVIERLDDPLVHLLRNSIDHGIEPPEEREAAGKPRQGRIVFSAEHSGGNVIITISDDGRGIDVDTVRAKAIEKGLIAADAVLSDKELLNFVFEPGFSTAAQVSDLSGRGVGMDVVKQNITALRGKVSIVSEKGRGATIRMRLPLTLAIIDGLKVRIRDEYFIVPLAVVSECLELNRQKTGRPGEDRFISLRDQIVPFLRLRDWFAIHGEAIGSEQVVIVSVDKKMVGLVVDEVIGLQQTVIKNLGESHKDVPGISGATIQGDGSIALILDVEPLIAKVQETVGNKQSKKFIKKQNETQ